MANYNNIGNSGTRTRICTALKTFACSGVRKFTVDIKLYSYPIQIKSTYSNVAVNHPANVCLDVLNYDLVVLCSQTMYYNYCFLWSEKEKSNNHLAPQDYDLVTSKLATLRCI